MWLDQVSNPGPLALESEALQRFDLGRFEMKIKSYNSIWFILFNIEVKQDVGVRNGR